MNTLLSDCKIFLSSLPLFCLVKFSYQKKFFPNFLAVLLRDLNFKLIYQKLSLFVIVT